MISPLEERPEPAPRATRGMCANLGQIWLDCSHLQLVQPPIFEYGTSREAGFVTPDRGFNPVKNAKVSAHGNEDGGDCQPCPNTYYHSPQPSVSSCYQSRPC